MHVMFASKIKWVFILHFWNKISYIITLTSNQKERNGKYDKYLYLYSILNFGNVDVAFKY